MNYKLICILLFTLTGCTNLLENKLTIKQPNVIIILADDLGYYDLSFMGSTFYETPNLDKLAQQSLVFYDGYSASPVCSPSRASILLGKNPVSHGMTDWLGALVAEDWALKNPYSKLLPPKYEKNIKKEYQTLPEILKENGYKTFFAGKWHIGDKKNTPETHGFDINIGGNETGSPKGGYFSPFNNPNIVNLSLDKSISLPKKIVNETVSFINKNKSKPFLAFVSFYSVHGPLQTTKEKWNKYRIKALKNKIKIDGFLHGKKLPIRNYQDNPIYAGMIELMDESIGFLLKELKRLGLDENTVILFTSDNGGVVSGDKYSTTNKPLKGGKGHYYEGGIKVPFLIKVPWLKKTQKESNFPVIGMDIYPTIIDLLNISSKSGEYTDGISIKPILEGKKLKERPLFWHYPHYGNQGGNPGSIVRLGKWKLIFDYEDNKTYLFDLENDFSESRNVSSEYPIITQKLSSLLEDFLNKNNAKKPIGKRGFNQEKSLKYHANKQNQIIRALNSNRLKQYQSDWQPNKNWWKSSLENR